MGPNTQKKRKSTGDPFEDQVRLIPCMESVFIAPIGAQGIQVYWCVSRDLTVDEQARLDELEQISCAQQPTKGFGFSVRLLKHGVKLDEILPGNAMLAWKRK